MFIARFIGVAVVGGVSVFLIVRWWNQLHMFAQKCADVVRLVMAALPPGLKQVLLRHRIFQKPEWWSRVSIPHWVFPLAFVVVLVSVGIWGSYLLMAIFGAVLAWAAWEHEKLGVVGEWQIFQGGFALALGVVAATIGTSLFLMDNEWAIPLIFLVLFVFLGAKIRSWVKSTHLPKRKRVI
ncbi:hypothetical protein HZC00_05585 [Candidatus Kaiserbacteria bacterium]|nr:hypothetical protein [Candidatus Kaiserbacteria bacterium]